MDVDSLKAELEKHLAKNPDEHAPHGFRDRFNTLVEQYQSEGDCIPKPYWSSELQQIRNEAEAAAKAAGTEPADDPADAPRSDVVAAPRQRAGRPRQRQRARPTNRPMRHRPAWESGAILVIVAIVVVLAARLLFLPPPLRTGRLSPTLRSLRAGSTSVRSGRDTGGSRSGRSCRR